MFISKKYVFLCRLTCCPAPKSGRLVCRSVLPQRQSQEDSFAKRRFASAKVRKKLCKSMLRLRKSGRRQFCLSLLHQRRSKKKKSKAMLCRPFSLLLSITFCVLAALQAGQSTKKGNTALILKKVGAVVRALGFRDPALYNQHSTPDALHPTLYNLRSTVKYARMCVYASTCEAASMYA